MRLPLNDATLKKHNFFELYPLDGGGSLIFQEILGTLDDAKIADAILRRGIMDQFGKLPALDFARFERWRSIEKSCWLNRCYFVASLARHYWLTGDERVARIVKETMLHFIRAYPPPEGRKAISEHIKYVYHIRDHHYNRQTYEQNQRDETDVKYIWFDFQPASRVIHFCYALHFLKDSPSVSDVERAEIAQGIRQHAEVILTGEQCYRRLVKGDNHQSIRAVALLFAGALMEGGDRRREFIREGARIINFHAAADFCPDGSLAENSPSYHVFEAWHLRDAYLLSRSCGFGLRRDIKARLEKAARYIEAIRQPDGRSPVLNDGYPVNLTPFLASLPGAKKAVHASTARKSAATFHFRDAGLGAYRDGRRYLLLDASVFTGVMSHYHAGKNALLYWQDGKPFFVDSGCCSYDDALFADWYKQGQAHSSLLVNGQGDGVIRGICYWVRHATTRCAGWRKNGERRSISATLTSNAPGWKGVRWSRQVEVQGDDAVLVRDVVRSPRRKSLEFVFNLHPDVTITRSGGALILANGGARVRFSTQTQGGCNAAVALSAGKCFIDFKHRASRRIVVKIGPVRSLVLETRMEATRTQRGDGRQTDANNH